MVQRTQVSPLCSAMPCDLLPGSQGLSILNPGSPRIGSLPGSGCLHPPWLRGFWGPHCHVGDVAGAPGNGDVVVVQTRLCVALLVILNSANKCIAQRSFLKPRQTNCYSRLPYCIRTLRRDLIRLAFDSHLIQSNAFESNASANANADESNANASANTSATKESSASANANAAFALAFANADSSRLYAGETAVSRYSSPVITCRQRLLKPFQIRDTAFVWFLLRVQPYCNMFLTSLSVKLICTPVSSLVCPRYSCYSSYPVIFAHL